MQRQYGDRGAALILLISIVAALAILATALTSATIAQMRATATDRTRKNVQDYAEAALDNAVTYAKQNLTTHPMTSTSTWLTPAELAAAFPAGTFPPGATVTYLVYDNCANGRPSVTTDSNGDGMMWIEVTITYKGKTSRMRALVTQKSQSVLSSFPRAVLFADNNIQAGGSGNTGDFYAVNRDGTPDVSGSPYPTSIMAGGNFVGNSTMDLAAPGTSTQSVGIKAHGTISTPGHSFIDQTTGANVGLLSDYFDQATQADLGDLSQTGAGPAGKGFANASAPVYTTKTALLAACSYNSTTKTYTASTDLAYNSSTTLLLNTAGTTYNFKSLYVNGNLTLNSTTTTKTSALYVSGNFTISGPTSANSFGPIYVGGTISWTCSSASPHLSVSTVNYLNPTAGPQSLWAGIITTQQSSGAGSYFDLILGDTWITGNAGTSDVAINFAGPASGSASTVMCPLLSTTEKTVTSGEVDCGSMTKPMIYFMQCDNDGLYSNTCEWGSTGTFYGLMVIMEASITLSNGDGVQPSIVGSLLCGCPNATDITVEDKSLVCYNQAVIDAVTNSALTTTTVVTTVVPGSWQELPGK
jgi:Tfp pilus assembly protein PilX